MGRINYAHTQIKSDTHWVPPMCEKTTVHTHIHSHTHWVPPMCGKPIVTHIFPHRHITYLLFASLLRVYFIRKSVSHVLSIHFFLSFLMLCNKNCLATKSYMKRNYWFSYTNKSYWFIFSYSKTNFPPSPSLKKKDKENLIWQWSGKLIWYVDKREITKNWKRGKIFSL